MPLKILTAIASLMVATTVASAQQASPQPLPAGCPAATGQQAQPSHAPAMQGQHMSETHQGLMEAMAKMQPAMMQGMMARDPDVAWICAMIPHHRGAIDMARAGLRGASDAESRKMAEETIKMQEEEIAKLEAWVSRHAARENRTGSVPRQ